MPYINEDIIDLNEKFTLEFDAKEFRYLNTKLKDGLTEGKDFEYLDFKTWEVLLDAFEGHELKRMIEKGPDGKVV